MGFPREYQGGGCGGDESGVNPRSSHAVVGSLFLNLSCRDASETWHLEPSACGEISPTFWRSGMTELMSHKMPFVKTPIFASHC